MRCIFHGVFSKLFEAGPQPEPRTVGRLAKRLGDYQWAATTPVVAVHIMAILGLVWAAMGWVPWEAWAACFVLYWIRMWGVTGGYHRYFAHRTYKTSRAFQFVIAIIAQLGAQRGVLWWAAHHRDHHKYSDQERDVHSPTQHGLMHAHIGWIYDHNGDTDYERIKDMAKYPELVFLNKLWFIPVVSLGIASFLWLGWAGLFVTFAVNTVLIWHGTFTINSLSHVWGKPRYKTNEDSKNHWFLAIITMGEGWHNNHHHFMNSCRQGFFWWEVDATYYILKAMSWVGLVWDLKPPPARVYGQDLEDFAVSESDSAARGKTPRAA